MFTKDELKAFRVDFADVTKTLESKYGVKIELQKISYSETDFTSKIRVTKLGENGMPKINEQNFNMAARLLDVPVDWMNKEFVTRQGEKLRIIGLNIRRPKNAIELIGVNNGKKYKASVDYVKQFVK